MVRVEMLEVQKVRKMWWKGTWELESRMYWDAAKEILSNPAQEVKCFPFHSF